MPGEEIIVSLALSAAIQLIQTLRAERRPPTDEEVEQLDAQIGVEHAALTTKLAGIAGDPDATEAPAPGVPWDGKLQTL